MKTAVPKEFDLIRERARRATAPMKPADENTRAKQNFLFSRKCAVGADGLPAPYLIYFLLVELLSFKDLGRDEKLLWSIPVDFEGKGFLIEHQKFGAGVFTQDDEDLDVAKDIALLIKKGVRCARPYFKWKADQAVKSSKFSVVNNGDVLFRRYQYLKGMYERVWVEAEKKRNELTDIKLKNMAGYIWPYCVPIEESGWLAMAAIDAFFSWTEHIFIHFAILNSSITTGENFTTLACADWNVKFKHALDISDSTMKGHFDGLIEIRRQLRNFVGHGAFGKDGETLYFHSRVGAVPVLLDVTKQRAKFSLSERLQFDATHAFDAIEKFIVYLSADSREPAWMYIQELGLPSIMTMAQDGTYQKAVASREAMERFAFGLAQSMDDAANMDWGRWKDYSWEEYEKEGLRVIKLLRS
jgi:hypothetical protein